VFVLANLTRYVRRKNILKEAQAFLLSFYLKRKILTPTPSFNTAIQNGHQFTLFLSLSSLCEVGQRLLHQLTGESGVVGPNKTTTKSDGLFAHLYPGAYETSGSKQTCYLLLAWPKVLKFSTRLF
jgi:hypothetical protein